MKVINRKQINRNDWKNFIRWSNKEQFIYSDTNFYTGFLSINKIEIEKSLIDFFLYNKFVMKNSYKNLAWPEWLVSIKGNDIEEWISNLFEYHFVEYADVFNGLLPFLFEIRRYRISDIKDNDKEYEYVQLYWNFISKLRKAKIDNYNKWITYVNKKIHIDTKGYK